MKDDRTYLLHIRDAIVHIVDYTEGGRATFLQDTKTQDAVVRNLEIIGEAVKHLSERIRETNPQVSWRRIAGMRDMMIHEYFGVNMELVWGVVEEELPPFLETIEKLIEER